MGKRANDQDQGRLIGGAILISLGVFLLAVNMLGGIGLGRWGWTFWIIGPGVLLFIVALAGGEKSAQLATPAALVTGTGLILLFQSITDYWESWAYLWALYPVFVGVGMWTSGILRDNDDEVSLGSRLISIGVKLLIGFGLFFELFIFHSIFGCLGGLILPAILIILGLWLLNRRVPIADEAAKWFRAWLADVIAPEERERARRSRKPSGGKRNGDGNGDKGAQVKVDVEISED